MMSVDAQRSVWQPYGGNSGLINGLGIPRASLQFHARNYFPLRGESRDVSAVPVKTVCALSLPIAHGAAGAVGARLSLRPLIGEGATNAHTSGEIAPRDRNLVSFHVIASEAKQSSFAAAMEAGLLRRFAPRNDGAGCLKIESGRCAHSEPRAAGFVGYLRWL